jgi:hypothetical protein
MACDLDDFSPAASIALAVLTTLPWGALLGIGMVKRRSQRALSRAADASVRADANLVPGPVVLQGTVSFCVTPRGRSCASNPATTCCSWIAWML